MYRSVPQPYSFLLAVFALAMLAGCDTVRQDIALVTEALTMPSAGEAANMMIDPHHPDDRRKGTVLIANAPFGAEEVYVRFYRESVDQEDDPTVLAASVSALARHGAPEDAPRIARHLRHESVHVRWEAAKGLQRLHNPQVVPNLLTTVRDVEEEARVRVAAAHALGQYPQDRVFHALIGALDSRHLSLNLTAEQSLATLTGQSLGLDSIAWTRWYNAQPSVERFAGQQEYLYHTYPRDETLLERLAFWTTRRFEQPGVPAGLDPQDRRRTYDE